MLYFDFCPSAMESLTFNGNIDLYRGLQLFYVAGHILFLKNIPGRIPSETYILHKNYVFINIFYNLYDDIIF